VKTPLRRLGHRWEENIKTNICEMCFKFFRMGYNSSLFERGNEFSDFTNAWNFLMR